MFRLKESRLEKLFQLGPQSKELIPRSEEFHFSDSLESLLETRLNPRETRLDPRETRLNPHDLTLVRSY